MWGKSSVERASKIMNQIKILTFIFNEKQQVVPTIKSYNKQKYIFDSLPSLWLINASSSSVKFALFFLAFCVTCHTLINYCNEVI